jgi:hypothetical protein
MRVQKINFKNNFLNLSVANKNKIIFQRILDSELKLQMSCAQNEGVLGNGNVAPPIRH